MSGTARFNRAEAAFLARAASVGLTVTYGEFAALFGGIAQGQGPKLTAMGERLRRNNLPLLPVIVVNATTGLPSNDAVFYRSLGLEDSMALEEEQRRCFAFDWTKVSFWEDEK